MDEPFTQLASPGEEALSGNLSVVDLIIETMKQALLRGDVMPGQRLPSEPDLAEQFGVSRSAVREAMKVLSALGVITIRHGSGTYIAESASPKVLNPLIFGMMLEPAFSPEFTEFRAALQLSYCQLASQNATAEDLNALEQHVKQLEQAQRHNVMPETLVRLEFHLHLRILQAAHNHLVQQLGRTAEELFFYTLINRLTPYEQFDGGAESYRQLYAAIKAQDVVSLTEALQRNGRYWQQVIAQTY
jgi:DNA-binding FadR family transcriptional regulator